jgi:cytochrome bd-type quinol oxidase subunit 2
VREERRLRKILTAVLLLMLALPLLAQTDAESEAAGAAALAAGGISCVIGLVALVVWILIVVWVYRDAKARGMDNAVLWLVIVLITGLLGLIIYLVIRPKGEMGVCPSCGKKRMAGLARCPTCGNP